MLSSRSHPESMVFVFPVTGNASVTAESRLASLWVIRVIHDCIVCLWVQMFVLVCMPSPCSQSEVLLSSENILLHIFRHSVSTWVQPV